MSGDERAPVGAAALGPRVGVRSAELPVCAVVVVSYNSSEDLPGLLDSLKSAGAEADLRTVVVDNASSDGSALLVRERGFECVDSGGNLGYAGAINAALRRIDPSLPVLVLNPDVVLSPGAVTALLAALDDPAVGIAVPLVLDADGAVYPSLRREPTVLRALGDALLGRRAPDRPAWAGEMVWAPEAYAQDGDVDWATGAVMLFSPSCRRAVGEWDERFFLYAEEVDVAARARRAGFRVRFVPGAVARHRQGGSGSFPSLTALLAVNRVRYFAKHHRGPQVGLFRALVALHEGLRSYDAGHRLALRAVLRRSTWGEAATGDTRSRGAVTTVLGSLVIPAHDEAVVIGRCLDTVLSGFSPAELEVVVACNGCTDDTAARAHAAAPTAHVLDLPEPSKPAALRAAERVVTALPRLYLDADVLLPSSAARAVLERLQRGDVLAARPPISYGVSGADRLVQRYYRARSGTPAVMSSLWGAGVYGLSAEGRGRFADYPDVVAEDLFVDQLFASDEIAVVDCAPVVVNVPRTSRDLVRVLRRTYRGKTAMVDAGAADQTAGGTLSDLSAYARRGRGPAVDAAVYAGFALAGRVRPLPGRSVRWERDEKPRSPS